MTQVFVIISIACVMIAEQGKNSALLAANVRGHLNSNSFLNICVRRRTFVCQNLLKAHIHIIIS